MTDNTVLGTVPMEELFPHIQEIRGIPIGFLDDEQKTKARERIQYLESTLDGLREAALEADTAYVKYLDDSGRQDRLTIAYRLDVQRSQQKYHEAWFEISQLRTLIARSLGVRKLK